ncbi:MAG: hypothetical protein Q4G43_03705 [Mobilicoccus sp.]|nr:hypothetical protein [Mobilicoccus sp.]
MASQEFGLAMLSFEHGTPGRGTVVAMLPRTATAVAIDWPSEWNADPLAMAPVPGTDRVAVISTARGRFLEARDIPRPALTWTDEQGVERSDS